MKEIGIKELDEQCRLHNKAVKLLPNGGFAYILNEEYAVK